MPKIWVGRTTLNGEKKEDGLTMFNLPYLLPCDDQNYPFELKKIETIVFVRFLFRLKDCSDRDIRFCDKKKKWAHPNELFEARLLNLHDWARPRFCLQNFFEQIYCCL